MDIKSIYLEPCPFCGYDKPKLTEKRRGEYRRTGENYQGLCGKCKARGPLIKDDPLKAAEAWNRYALTTKLPDQPVYIAPSGAVAFRGNAIVEWLWENGHVDLNRIAIEDFPQEHREQFAQLLGYSIGGYFELSYVSDDAYIRALKARNAILGKDKT